MKIDYLASGRKIISYGPKINKPYKTEQSFYEFSGKRLEINTIFENNKKIVQDKTLTHNGRILKELIIKFKDGLRDKILRLV